MIVPQNRLLFWFAVVAVMSGAVLLIVLLPREPSYEGKSLSYWLRQCDSSQRTLPETFKEALHQMGTNALPHLVARLGKKDSRMKVWALNFCRRHNWRQPALLRPAWKDQNAAALALSELGESASSHVSEIAKHLSDYDTSLLVAPVLVSIGQRAIPALTNALATPDAAIRINIAFALRRLGPNAGTAIPTLIACLYDRDYRVRSSAATALGNINQEPQIVLPALAVCLSQSDPVTQHNALEAIGQFKEAASSVLPDVLRAMQDPEKNVRFSAAKCITRIIPDPVALFVSQLDDFDPKMRETTAFGLQLCGKGEQRVVTALTVLLQDENDAVRSQAEEALKANRLSREKKLSIQ